MNINVSINSTETSLNFKLRVPDPLLGTGWYGLPWDSPYLVALSALQRPPCHPLGLPGWGVTQEHLLILRAVSTALCPFLLALTRATIEVRRDACNHPISPNETRLRGAKGRGSSQPESCTTI